MPEVKDLHMKLSELVNITPIQVVRDAQFSSLGYLDSEDQEQLAYVENKEFLEAALSKSNISCILTDESLARDVSERVGMAIAVNPRKSFFEIHNTLATKTEFYWKSFVTEIARSAKVHPTTYIAQKDVRIGEESIIGPNVTVYERSIIGDHVTIYSGSIIGIEGFEYKRFGDELIHVVHAGGVMIEEGVEIFGNAVIQKALFTGYTKIGENTKINNLVHIGHNTVIGRRCLVGQRSSVAGSCRVGDDVWVGPGVSVANGINIGNSAYISIGSVVTRSVESGGKVSGNFAIEHERFLAFLKSIR